MATFGNATPGANSDWLNGNQFLGTQFTSPSDAGTLTSMQVYFQAATSSFNVKYAVYNLSGTLLASSAGGAITTTGFTSQNISLALSPSTVYVLGLIFQVNGDASHAYNYTNSGNTSYVGSSAGYSSPTNVSFSTVPNYNMTVVATYTPTTSGPVNVKTWDGVTQSTGIKTYKGVALASVKNVNGVA